MRRKKDNIWCFVTWNWFKLDCLISSLLLMRRHISYYMWEMLHYFIFVILILFWNQGEAICTWWKANFFFWCVTRPTFWIITIRWIWQDFICFIIYKYYPNFFKHVRKKQKITRILSFAILLDLYSKVLSRSILTLRNTFFVMVFFFSLKIVMLWYCSFTWQFDYYYFFDWEF